MVVGGVEIKVGNEVECAAGVEEPIRSRCRACVLVGLICCKVPRTFPYCPPSPKSVKMTQLHNIYIFYSVKSWRMIRAGSALE